MAIEGLADDAAVAAFPAWTRDLAEYHATTMASPVITLAPGATAVLGIQHVRRGGFSYLQAQFVLAAAKAAGNASLILLGTLQDGYRPLVEVHATQALGTHFYITPDGQISLAYTPLAVAAGSSVHLRALYMSK